jgi:hypothetical protein
MYKVKAGMSVPSAFLEAISPQSCAAFGPAIAQVLALPLLWAAYERVTICEGTTHTIIPADLAGKIHAMWIGEGGIGDVNPVEKIPLVVQQNGDQLVLVPRFHDGAGGDELGGGMAPASAIVEATSAAGIGDSEREVLLSQNQFLHQCLVDAKSDLVSILSEHRRYMVTMNSSIRRIATQPFARAVASPSSTTPSRKQAKLSKAPRDLFVLWKEYEQGLDGRKPAKDFTENERGQDRYNYYRRHIFWEQVEKLIGRGNTADCAIDQIKAVYGQSSSVTAVINQMKKDRAMRIQRF